MLPELTLPQLPQDELPRALYLVLGVVLLIAGRKLFWLALGLAGAAGGLWVAAAIPLQGPAWVHWAVAAGGAVLGALLAIFVQKVAVGVTGFLAGGAGAVWVAQSFALLPASAGVPAWVAVFVVGGVIVALVAGRLFDGALVAISSLTGAAILVGATSFQGNAAWGLFAALALVGLLAQTGALSGSGLGRRGPKPARRRHEE